MTHASAAIGGLVGCGRRSLPRDIQSVLSFEILRRCAVTKIEELKAQSDIAALAIAEQRYRALVRARHRRSFG